VSIECIEEIAVVRRSLDARKARREPAWVHTLDLSLSGRPSKTPRGIRLGAVPERTPRAASKDRPLKGENAIVVGTGPAGIFAALGLQERGASVTVLEQGPPLKDRVAAVADLWRQGVLHPDANVQYGEGGAGTFSDGKLRTRVKDPLVREVLSRMVDAGASEAILEEAHPHLGTDGVRGVVSALRTGMEAAGARIDFRRRVVDLERTSSGYALVTDTERYEATLVFLAVGHSSRQLFRRLMTLGVPFKAKGMAMGVRAEHPQPWVDACQYGRFAGHPDLPSAEYFLTSKDGPTGRGVYSFCMCPGGVVVNSASEPDGLVTNGMSMSHRASGFANAGIVVTVSPGDFGDDAERGLAMQEGLERRGFQLGGGDYMAPAQTIRSFLDNRTDEKPLKSTFRPGIRPVNLRGFFPAWIEEPLARAFQNFERKMPGFIDKGVLLAPETRTSSPLQVRREEGGWVDGFPGLWMVGEGAGWAGGIVSSAVDALRCVEKLAISKA
jgi:uncharacterized FAD-dependent dehydrogenase